MEGFTIRTDLTQEDWHAYVLASQARSLDGKSKPALRYVMWLPRAFMLLIGVTLLVCLFAGWSLMAPLAAFLGISVYTGIWQFVTRYAIQSPDRGIFIGPGELEFNAQGMHLRRESYRSVCAWDRFQEITQTDAHLFVWIDRFTAQTVPIRDLPAGMTPADFRERIQRFVTESAAAPTDVAAAVTPPIDIQTCPAVASPTPAAPDATPEPGVLAELAQVGRLYAHRLADDRLLVGRDPTIVLLLLLAIALTIGLDRIAYGDNAEFMWYGVLSVPWMLLIAVVTAWLLSRISRPKLTMARAMLLTAAITPIAAAAFGLFDLLGKAGKIFCFAVGIGASWNVVSQGLRSLTHARQHVAFGAAAAWLGLSVYVSSQMYFLPSFWFEPEPEMRDEWQPDSIAKREALLFGQSQKIDAALARVQRDAGDHPQLFFVGFAGYADERVFAGEIALAEKVTAQRFGSESRSVRLINDRRDVESQPLATVPALRHAVLGMAKKMDVERDVLLLVVSSHGGEDGEVSVRTDHMSFTLDLDAARLREILDESGIRWRVIVVSACYSGAFVKPLADERTIVITASAEDRTSFGCSDERDLTYFGEAFFRDALPGSVNLRAAFEQARSAIGKREGQNWFMKASHPQAHFGALAEQKLADLDAALGTKVKSTRASTQGR